MSLLSVTVKKARYVGIQAPQFNTYVTLKLQNVKSTTVTVKGPTPCWEQDFLFETNDINQGLLVEVWNKGVIWDRALGYHYLPLTSVAYTEQECGGRWIELEAQLMMRGGAVVGTTGPTGHALLLDCRFEPPFDAEGTGGADLQRKLDLLNGALDAERAEQARRQMQYIAHSGYSEDSDYTSDLNYPVGQHANCSASQFRNAAHQMHTPQRSLEVSRENSYERDEYHIHGDTDPLYYNSQPRTNRIETWSQLHAQASVESGTSWRTATDWQSGEEQRRPSLERQNTLYDDGVGYGYDPFTNSTHIRDHSHNISQQHSYEEYYDSTSYPYQTSYLGDDSRQWDSGGQFFFDDNLGITPTEYENAVNKRRSSVVQLPQVPPKQLPPSSRYSDYNEMAPYRPRQRRTAASLPATPSSTPKRGRALPIPPGSETGSLRSGRGRRLPRPPAAAVLPAAHTLPPTPAHQHVPYAPEPNRIPDESFGCSNYVDTDYNDYTSFDEDGMQPFFDETPHATPPGAAQKPSSWIDADTTFTYPVTSDEDTVISKSVQSVILNYKLQPPLTSQQDVYQEGYQQYGEPYEETQQYQFDQQDQRYEQNQFYQDQYENKQDFEYQQPFEQPYQEVQTTQQQPQFQQGQLQFQQQHLQQPMQLHQQQHQQDLLKQQELQQQQYQHQQKQPAQQLQASVLTGAATLGSLMAGGAKKLGSFFGAAAAAVAPPHASQAIAPAVVTTTTSSQFTSAIAPVTPFTSTITAPITASVPEVSPLVPVSIVTTSTTPVILPRTPSLRRQESIQRPPVRRTRTLPDAPEDLPPSSYDDSAYEDEYNKTEYDQSIDRDKTSLDRFRDEDYVHDTIHEDVTEERRLSQEPSGLQKIASPTRNGLQKRKPSVDSYHSQAPSIVDRRTSQSSFHHDEKLTVPTTQEEAITDKSKVKFHDERTTYHEVPDQTNGFHESEPYDEQVDEFRDEREPFHEQEETFHEEDEKFEDQEQFNETDEAEYQEEDNVFQDKQRAEKERIEFQPEQPKLTPKQWWHRAYNKVVMQLNVSDFLDYNGKSKVIVDFIVY